MLRKQQKFTRTSISECCAGKSFSQYDTGTMTKAIIRHYIPVILLLRSRLALCRLCGSRSLDGSLVHSLCRSLATGILAGRFPAALCSFSGIFTGGLLCCHLFLAFFLCRFLTHVCVSETCCCAENHCSGNSNNY